MAQQTAVEWLFNELRKNYALNHSIAIQINREAQIWAKAKKMEKEQIKKAWFDSTLQFDNAASMVDKKEFEQYYNETYGIK